MSDADGYFGERRTTTPQLTSSPAAVSSSRSKVPDLRRLPPGQTAVPFHVSPARVAFDVYDVATQATSSNYVGIRAKAASISIREKPGR